MCVPILLHCSCGHPKALILSSCLAAETRGTYCEEIDYNTMGHINTSACELCHQRLREGGAVTILRNDKVQLMRRHESSAVSKGDSERYKRFKELVRLNREVERMKREEEQRREQVRMERKMEKRKQKFLMWFWS